MFGEEAEPGTSQGNFAHSGMHTQGKDSRGCMRLAVGDGLSLKVAHSLPACSILLGSLPLPPGPNKAPPPSLCLGPKGEDIFLLNFN